MSIRQFARNVGSALNNMAIQAHDSSARARVREIDEEIEQLKMERDYQIASLYEPRMHEVVSDDYVPGRYVPRPKQVLVGLDGGRLTTCEGRAYSGDRDVHPGCPYADKNHSTHEFTLRD